MKTILAFGEVLWDVFPTAARLGGAPFNFACRVDSLGDRGIIASRLGRDELGRKAREEIGTLGLDAGLVQWDDERPTGTVPVTVDEKGNPHFIITPDVAYDCIETTELLLKAAGRADCIAFGTLIQRTPVSRRALERVLDASGPAPKLLDINLRRDCYTAETIRASLERADVLKLNGEEMQHLAALLGMGEPSTAEFAARMLDICSLSHCLVTLGEGGAFAASARGERAYVPGHRVEVADTCGSGDAFAAGFIHRLLRGSPLAECCELGNALGAMVASQEGATGRIAPQELEDFMASARERVVDPEFR